MKLRDSLGVVILAVAISGMFGGLAAVSREVMTGWAAFAIGAVLAGIAYRLLREPSNADRSSEEPAKVPPPEPAE